MSCQSPRQRRATVATMNNRTWWGSAYENVEHGYGRRVEFHGSCVRGHVGGAPLPQRGDQVTLVFSDETCTRLLSVRCD